MTMLQLTIFGHYLCRKAHFSYSIVAVNSVISHCIVSRRGPKIVNWSKEPNTISINGTTNSKPVAGTNVSFENGQQAPEQSLITL